MVLDLLVYLVLLLILGSLLHFESTRLDHEVLEDLVEGDVATLDQEVEVVETGRLVLNEDEQ